VLVHVIYGLAFTTLFFRNFFVTIPDELVKPRALTVPVSGRSSCASCCPFPAPSSWCA
jgi:hypothetical protein